jgi:hypothetical protein
VCSRKRRARPKRSSATSPTTPDLKAEGGAQRDKGEAEHEANKAKAEANAHEAQAKEKELEQRAAEAGKD